MTDRTTDGSADLLPCPFCSAQPLVNVIEAHTHSPLLKQMGVPDHPGSVVIECGCGAGLIDDTLEAVRARWNLRMDRIAPEPGGEVGWLVEVVGGSGALWLKFSPASGGGAWFRDWTDTASDALRFSRKDDAESYISAHMPCVGARATEHMWCNGPQPETKGDGA